MIQRIKTGIDGFDKLIEGGLLKNSVNMLSGGTGTGKTLFGILYLLNGAKKFNEKGMYFTFEETEEDLKADIESIGFNLSETGKKIKFVYVAPYNIEDFISFLRDQVAAFKPARVVIDSLTAIVLPMSDDFERKKAIFRINEELKGLNCTTILISEIPSDNMNEQGIGSFSRFGVEEFLCDSVIVLHYAGLGGEADRAVRIVKMRRTNHVKGPVPLTIGKNGIKVSAGKYKY